MIVTGRGPGVVAVQTAPRPVTVEIGRRQMNLVFGTVMLGMLLSALDQTTRLHRTSDDRR
jgi:hypothetical protein